MDALSFLEMYITNIYYLFSHSGSGTGGSRISILSSVYVSLVAKNVTLIVSVAEDYNSLSGCTPQSSLDQYLCYKLHLGDSQIVSEVPNVYAHNGCVVLHLISALEAIDVARSCN